jgi:hypothetical protein
MMLTLVDAAARPSLDPPHNCFLILFRRDPRHDPRREEVTESFGCRPEF